MAWVTVAGAGISLLPAVFKGIQGNGQTSKANAINPTNPGYQVNRGVLDNARTVSDIYGNYQIPGYTAAKNNIDSTAAGAFAGGVQGASSGGDVLDLATKMAYGKNKALSGLAMQNAQGKEAMLGTYLKTNAAAGQEYQDQNGYDRDQYDRQIKEKAALDQAGAENTYGALDQLSGAIAPAVSNLSFGSGRSPSLQDAKSTTAMPALNLVGSLPNNPFMGSNDSNDAIANIYKKYYNKPI